MKKIIPFIIVAFALGACCKKDIQIGVRLSYPNLSEPTDMLVFQKNVNTNGNFDTIVLAELNPMNNYTLFINLERATEYIIEVDSIYSDTISDVNYEIKGFNCSAKVKDFSYQHNRVLKTDYKLDIK